MSLRLRSRQHDENEFNPLKFDNQPFELNPTSMKSIRFRFRTENCAGLYGRQQLNSARINSK
jgi:hypothetical protein